MAYQLGSESDLPGVRFDIQHLHGANNHLCNSSARGPNALFWSQIAPGMHMVQMCV